ncbi:twin-arginine translocase TatA/TatE family subunit [Desulfatibacillum aliphaticivorans]|uniref:twin-arginine translocase TatA/TatE family subunit n=1 Tax=Desulfatibacillum aliphaticivorans TaxID=218208 RepID=UPI00040D1A1C|nr:twin-arginine translocase TatA/TatE family subunit [Desulfatibacillum aliphaticivorans]
MMGGIGSTELLIVLGIVIILFGGKKIPEIGAGLGKGIRNFKNATSKKEIDEKNDKEEKDKIEE